MYEFLKDVLNLEDVRKRRTKNIAKSIQGRERLSQRIILNKQRQNNNVNIGKKVFGIFYFRSLKLFIKLN